MRFRAGIAVAVALAAAAAFGGGCPEAIDWSAAREFAPGMRSLHLTLDEPRLMENYMVRVDLRTPGLRVTGTGRAANWGEVMADVTNRVMLIDTVRRTTRSFLDDHRAHGTNMVLAVNTSPWGPWEPPFTHRHARLPHLAVLNGEVVSHATKRGPMLVVFTNNAAVVTNALDDADLKSVAVAHPGFSIIMRGGETTAKKGRGPNLAPRTAFGLSADGRYLYILVVDGRQRGYSHGADMFDLAKLLKAAGASDAINMDGGGSSTLVRWDGEKGEAVTDNRHDPDRRYYRNVAASLGFYFADAAWDVRGPASPKPHERTAVDDVRDYVGRCVAGGSSVDGSVKVAIHVGDTDFARAHGLSSERLKDEQWVVKSFGGDVVINGGGTRGCLYGAYHFIEDCLGVRFWSEAEEDVPPASDLALPALDLGGKPFFAYRDIYRNMKAKESTSAFAIRRRLNRNGEVPVPAELGGSYRYGPPNHCHSASIYIPWEKYGKDHPEYFALREGVRVGGRGMQLCLSNPGVFDVFLSTLRANIAKGEADAAKAGVPPPTMYDVSMNDTPNFCQCGECAAMSEKLGISGLYLDFANRLARAVAKEHPGVFVSTLAYYFTEELPKCGIVPEDNLIVRLCDTRSNQAASIYEPGNDVFLKLLGEWGPVTKNLFVWDYAAIYAKTTHTFPFPSEFYYGDQYRAYAKHGVKGIFLEHEDQKDGDLWEVKYYIETKLMEDPFVDDAALLKSAIREYYGPAAPHVWRIRRHLDKIRKERKAFIGWTPELGEFDFITPDDCRRMSAAYDRAEAAAAGDGRYLRRVRKTRVGTDDISRLIASFEKYRQGDGWRFDPEDLDIVGKTAPLAVVDDPASPSGKAVRFDMDKDPNGHYKLPFCIGVRNQAIRETPFVKFFREIPSADGYGVYTLENVEFPRDSFVFMSRSWQLQRQTGYPQLTRGSRRYDIRVHARYAGPKAIPGDTRENALFVGRVEFVPSSGTDSKGTGK